MRFHSLVSLISLVGALWGATPAFAAPDEPSQPLVQARLIIDDTLTEDGHKWVGVAFRITPEWHIYWQNPGDSGIPTSLTWESLPKGVSAGNIHWPVPKRASMGGLTNYGYEDEVILPVPLALKQGDAAGELRVKAQWLVCRETCIPEEATLTGSLDEASAPREVKALNDTIRALPTPHTGEAYVMLKPDVVQIAIAHESTGNADIFPIDDGWIKNNVTPTLSNANGWTGFTVARGSASPANSLALVASLHTKEGQKHLHVTAQKVGPFPASVPASLFLPKAVTADTAPIGLMLALLFAFLGGLILNLMPCVLPVLSLKALSLAKKADASRRDALRHGVAYTLGVLLSFALIGGAMLALKAGGAAIGWGFQLQSPAFVFGLLIVVFLVALNLLGQFELPVLFGSRASALTSRDSWLGSFATGVLAVALATPCTAPFMAPALGAALTLPAASTMLVFLALGLGLALPYLLISLSPRLRRLLPKPGVWMLRFKEFLAFPMFATAAWLLWVLSQQTGSMGLLRALAVLVVLAFAIWALKFSTHRLWRAFFQVLLVGSVLCSVSFPPALVSQSTPHASALASVPFNPEQLASLRAAGTPVFVDATADWCITCKVNERVALNTESTRALFAERKITFMVADWTQRDAQITEWLASFGRNGVPLYVYYPPHKPPVVLPQIITPSVVSSTIEAHSF